MQDIKAHGAEKIFLPPSIDVGPKNPNTNPMLNPNPNPNPNSGAYFGSCLSPIRGLKKPITWLLSETLGSRLIRVCEQKSRAWLYCPFIYTYFTQILVHEHSKSHTRPFYCSIVSSINYTHCHLV